MYTRLSLLLFSAFHPLQALSAACGPVYGADGLAINRAGQVWISHYEDLRLGLLDPEKNSFQEFLLENKGNPFTAARNNWSKSEGFDYSFDFGLTGVAVDESRGFVWSGRFNLSDKLLRFSQADGGFSEFVLPGRTSARFDIPIDAQGNVWLITYQGLSKRKGGYLVKVTPDGKMEQWPFPLAEFAAETVAVDAQGRPWVGATPAGGNAPELYVLENGAFIRQALPEVGGHFGRLYGDHKGAVWFSAPDVNAVGRIVDGKVDIFSVPTAKATPHALTADNQGNLWFTEWSARKLGRIAPDGSVAEFALPPEEETPLAIKADGQGRIWFSAAFNYNLFRLDPGSGRLEEFPLPVPANWSKNGAHGLAACTVQGRHLASGDPLGQAKGGLPHETGLPVPQDALRHPKGFTRNRDAALFEQQCQSACHTWYRVDKAAVRRSDWGPTVDRMVEFNGAPIGAKERARIIRYLNKHYALLK